MKKLYTLIQILTGTLFVILIVNDFVPLLIEELGGPSGITLPIKFSPGGWKVKFFMIDHPPLFALYQIAFFATGLVLVMSAIFPLLPSKINLGITSGLILSALFVLIFPHTAYLIEQTPPPFMWAQIVAGAALLPGALKKQNINRIAQVSIIVAAVLATLLLALCLIKSIITLKFAIWLVLGVSILLLLKKRIVTQ